MEATRIGKRYKTHSTRHKHATSACAPPPSAAHRARGPEQHTRPAAGGRRGGFEAGSARAREGTSKVKCARRGETRAAAKARAEVLSQCPAA